MSPRLLLVACLAAAAMATPPAARSNLMMPMFGPGSGRIVSGWDAYSGQFPHHALIFADGMAPCGGSLISTTRVLTAAHCILWYKTFVIRLGLTHLVGHEHTSWTTDSRRAVPHPQYDSHFKINDVGVIFMHWHAPLSSYIKVVQLPSGYDLYETFEGRDVILSGWGFMSQVPLIPDVLQWTWLTVIGNQECQLHYGPGTIHKSMICTLDYSYTSAECFGDDGSPLIVSTWGGYMQIGLVNHVPWDCSVRVPTVYTRLTSFVYWINSLRPY